MTAIEYALIGAIVSVAMILALVVAGDAVVAMHESVAEWVAWAINYAVDGPEQPPPAS